LQINFFGDYIKAFKRYGQNFLVDKNIINKIITEFSPQRTDCIVEIGPGLGALTYNLYAACDNFTAIEIDESMCKDLMIRFPLLNIINADFLKVNLENISSTNNLLRIIGNIPYNITTSLIFKLSENHPIISDILLMMQSDAVKRLTAEKGTKDYNASNIIANYFFEIEACFNVSASSFKPKPNVNSAVVKLVPRKYLDKTINRKKLISFIKTSFLSRRKTLKNSIQNSIFNDYDFTGIGVDLSKRAEELELKDFIQITKFIQSCDNDRTKQK
jgi:16S rRNA (adenine1518-N6/adenine1519-N6)-dimethyltransferase